MKRHKAEKIGRRQTATITQTVVVCTWPSDVDVSSLVVAVVAVAAAAAAVRPRHKQTTK